MPAPAASSAPPAGSPATYERTGPATQFSPLPPRAGGGGWGGGGRGAEQRRHPHPPTPSAWAPPSPAVRERGLDGDAPLAQWLCRDVWADGWRPAAARRYRARHRSRGGPHGLWRGR